MEIAGGESIFNSRNASVSEEIAPDKDISFIITEPDSVLTLDSAAYAGIEVSLTVLANASVIYNGTDGNQHTDVLSANKKVVYVYTGSAWFCSSAVDPITSKNITNCLTYVPQDIKLELENGTLTLKAGSKMYCPNGFEQDGTTPKFDVYTVPSDYNHTSTYPARERFFMKFGNGNVFDIPPTASFISGSTQPTVAEILVFWYDTANNVIKRTDDVGATWVAHPEYSLPLAVVHTNGTQISSIDQVFNGSGFIGKHAFVLPGLKGLCPNGFNEDGTNKNYEISSNKVSVIDLSPAWGTSLSGHKFFLRLFPNGGMDVQPDTRIVYSTPSSTYTGAYFNKLANKWEWYVSGALNTNTNFLFASNFLGTITASDASISNFNPPKVYQAENTESFTEDYSLGETFTGKYWIDGKPIYRKVIVVNETISAITNKPVGSLPNCETPIYMIGWGFRNDGVRISIPFAYAPASMASTDNAEMYISSTNSINLNLVSTYSFNKLIIITEYTKTTD